MVGGYLLGGRLCQGRSARLKKREWNGFVLCDSVHLSRTSLCLSHDGIWKENVFWHVVDMCVIGKNTLWLGIGHVVIVSRVMVSNRDILCR